MVNKTRVKNSLVSSTKSIYRATPILIGVTLLISLISSLVSQDNLISIFGKSDSINILIATLLGSIFAGNPINSYVIGGELFSIGLGIVAVTSFLIAWVTVGIIQLPAEIMILGRKFALTRNALSFIFSIIIALLISKIILIGGLIWKYSKKLVEHGFF